MRKVVITGIGAMSPNGTGKAAFQQAVIEGRSGLCNLSVFDASGFECRIAGEVAAGPCGFSKKELRNLPRAAQLAIAASDEALADSGLRPENLTEEERYRFGVLLGSGGGSIEFVERHYSMYFGRSSYTPSLYAVSASTAGGLSSEISIRHGLFGRSHVITTGCTSSTDALGYAFTEIRAGRLDRVLAGGADAPLMPGVYQGFSMMKLLATRWNDEPARGSRPFARDREGFVPAEGAWMFALESQESAAARGVKPYAEICGYASSCEAFHAVRLSDSGLASCRTLSDALAEAGTAPEEVDYVNLHGTSTILNDRVESAVMKSLFGKRAACIPMSSTKSMIGHPQGASGAAGIAATVLAMEKDYVHPTINLEDPDPECGLDFVPQTARRHDVRVALCNTLGFGSKCSAIVLRNLR
jgi:3-oxoacyl-[acyl-carrier-protein] synthase II